MYLNLDCRSLALTTDSRLIETRVVFECNSYNRYSIWRIRLIEIRVVFESVQIFADGSIKPGLIETRVVFE